MISSFFESLKYADYMVSVAFMRIYLGYYFLSSAWERLNGEFLKEPYIAEYLREGIANGQTPLWYQMIVESSVIPNWPLFAHFVAYCELAIGLSFIIGFLVRPVILVGLFLLVNFLLNSSPDVVETYRFLILIFVVLFWAGAGRCLGFDYFFYKRRRGIWW